MFEYVIYFLSLLNPFALFVYTLPLKKELGLRSYFKIMVLASVISYAVYLFFALLGEAFFSKVLQIEFDSFRIFGGIVLVAFALSYIVQGRDSFITIKGELSRIASEVALPFMVGAGTITLSIVIGNRLSAVQTSTTLLIVMALNLVCVISLALLRNSLRTKFKQVMDENLDILLRINGFIVGAFGVDLIITGILNQF